MAGSKQRISRVKLRDVIAKSLKHEGVSLAAVASRLKISSRSLQRQLALLDLSYSQLVDEVREDIARSLLAKEQLGIAEIGAALGYRDPSSFSRAFMRWTQMSPKDYRAALRLRSGSKTATNATPPRAAIGRHRS